MSCLSIYLTDFREPQGKREVEEMQPHRDDRPDEHPGPELLAAATCLDDARKTHPKIEAQPLSQFDLSEFEIQGNPLIIFSSKEAST